MGSRSTILIKAGEAIFDPWVYVNDDQSLPPGDIIVALDRLIRDESALLQHVGSLGVLLPPGAELAAIDCWLPRLLLVAIPFPIFRDGRSFSLARALRELSDFRGEIRAVGQVLPDQYAFLLRCGVTTVEIPSTCDAKPWLIAMRSFHTGYQPAMDANTPLSPLRRHLDLGGV
jgi:uncharacterized protein (DUF934 family)